MAAPGAFLDAEEVAHQPLAAEAVSLRPERLSLTAMSCPTVSQAASQESKFQPVVNLLKPIAPGDSH